MGQKGNNFVEYALHAGPGGRDRMGRLGVLRRGIVKNFVFLV